MNKGVGRWLIPVSLKQRALGLCILHPQMISLNDAKYTLWHLFILEY